MSDSASTLPASFKQWANEIAYLEGKGSLKRDKMVPVTRRMRW
jgi:hypothetical protein